MSNFGKQAYQHRFFNIQHRRPSPGLTPIQHSRVFVREPYDHYSPIQNNRNYAQVSYHNGTPEMKQKDLDTNGASFRNRIMEFSQNCKQYRSQSQMLQRFKRQAQQLKKHKRPRYHYQNSFPQKQLQYLPPLYENQLIQQQQKVAKTQQKIVQITQQKPQTRRFDVGLTAHLQVPPIPSKNSEQRIVLKYYKQRYDKLKRKLKEQLQGNKIKQYEYRRQFTKKKQKQQQKALQNIKKMLQDISTQLKNNSSLLVSNPSFAQNSQRDTNQLIKTRIKTEAAKEAADLSISKVESQIVQEPSIQMISRIKPVTQQKLKKPKVVYQNRELSKKYSQIVKTANDFQANERKTRNRIYTSQY